MSPENKKKQKKKCKACDKKDFFKSREQFIDAFTKLDGFKIKFTMKQFFNFSLKVLEAFQAINVLIRIKLMQNYYKIIKFFQCFLKSNRKNSITQENQNKIQLHHFKVKYNTSVKIQVLLICQKFIEEIIYQLFYKNDDHFYYFQQFKYVIVIRMIQNHYIKQLQKKGMFSEPSKFKFLEKVAIVVSSSENNTRFAQEFQLKKKMKIGLFDLLQRLQLCLNLQEDVIVTGLGLLKKSTFKNLKVTNSSIYKLAVVCIFIAHKVYSDFHHQVESFSLVSGLTIKEICNLEILMLEILEYDIILKQRDFLEMMWFKHQ